MEGFDSSDGVRIAYRQWPGARGTVVLHHGFAADHVVNWVAPGIVDRLVGEGWDVVALDARGHGESDHPSDPAVCGQDAMAADVSALADHLGLTAFSLVGYSMGAGVSLRVASREPRVSRLVLGGIGGAVVAGARAVDRSAVAAALLAEDPDDIDSPAAALFRRFAESTGADLRGLAAVASSPAPRAVDFGAITAPTLVVVGSEDALARRPEDLAAAIPGARLRVVSGDHLTAVVTPELVDAIAGFLVEGG